MGRCHMGSLLGAKLAHLWRRLEGEYHARHHGDLIDERLGDDAERAADLSNSRHCSGPGSRTHIAFERRPQHMLLRGRTAYVSQIATAAARNMKDIPLAGPMHQKTDIISTAFVGSAIAP